MRLPNWGPRPHNSQFLAIRQKSPQSLQTFSLATAGEQAQPGVAVTARKSMLPKDLPRLQRHLGVLVDRHYSRGVIRRGAVRWYTGRIEIYVGQIHPGYRWTAAVLRIGVQLDSNRARGQVTQIGFDSKFVMPVDGAHLQFSELDRIPVPGEGLPPFFDLLPVAIADAGVVARCRGDVVAVHILTD